MQIEQYLIEALNETDRLEKLIMPLDASARLQAINLLSETANLTMAVQAQMGLVSPTGFGTTGLLSLISLSAVQGQYHNTKSYLCCDVPTYAGNLWIRVTVLGWLCMALAVTCMGLLWILDKFPESSMLCSCACLRPFVPWRRQRRPATERDQSCVAANAEEGDSLLGFQIDYPKWQQELPPRKKKRLQSGNSHS